MTIHYHGTPITPLAVIQQLAGRSFCVSFSQDQDLATAHRIGQSVMLDNGAFSAWTQGRDMDWNRYYRWVEPWLDYQTTWAVIPDVIDGDENDNEKILQDWPFGTRGAPVWHMHESLHRLVNLAGRFPRVCIGSSGAYRIVGSDRWHERMTQAMNLLCGNGPPPVWLHMMRGMALGGSIYPFASIDSADIARNHNRPQNTAPQMAAAWDAQQCPARWRVRATNLSLPFEGAMT